MELFSASSSGSMTWRTFRRFQSQSRTAPPVLPTATMPFGETANCVRLGADDNAARDLSKPSSSAAELRADAAGLNLRTSLFVSLSAAAGGGGDNLHESRKVCLARSR